MRLFSIIIILFFLTSCVSSYPISDQLSEISGIENPVRSVYISINDSGDEPVLYIMKSDGVIFHKIFISGAKNVDWEDLSFDGDFLYVGDIGNNRNQRKDLMIYRIPWNNSWGNYYIDGKLNQNLPDTLRADPFSFNYPDQISFPPEESRMNFDSEALTYADGKILILSKDRSKPYQGLSKIYELDLSDKSSKTKLLQEIQLNGVSWLTGSVTACDYLNNKLYVLTYKRLYIFERTKGQFKLLRKKNLGRLQQWEGISVESESEVRIVAEKSHLGKQKMKIIKL